MNLQKMKSLEEGTVVVPVMATDNIFVALRVTTIEWTITGSEKIFPSETLFPMAKDWIVIGQFPRVLDEDWLPAIKAKIESGF